MIYVFDTNAFSQLFRSYYPKRFPTLWAQFDALIEDGKITSTREVRREIEDGPIDTLREWAKDRKHLFPSPTAEEGAYVAKVFAVSHFQQLLAQRTLLKGGRNADPFIVARAGVLGAEVVTMEGKPKHGAKIPNICEYFGIGCLSLEGFMEQENWRF